MPNCIVSGKTVRTLCLPPARIHCVESVPCSMTHTGKKNTTFWELTARFNWAKSDCGSTVPKKIDLYWFMPALANSRVGSERGTTEDEGTGEGWGGEKSVWRRRGHHPGTRRTKSVFPVLEIGEKGVSHPICSPLGDILVVLGSHGALGLVAEVVCRREKRRETRSNWSRLEGQQAAQQRRGRRHHRPAPRHDRVPHQSSREPCNNHKNQPIQYILLLALAPRAHRAGCSLDFRRRLVVGDELPGRCRLRLRLRIVLNAAPTATPRASRL